MKRLTSILALVLAGVMLLCALPLSAGAYGTADGKLIITHINVGPLMEGSAIIANGRNYKTVGQLGTFAWWQLFICDWSEEDGYYKIVTIDKNSSNKDKSSYTIPETGFVYGICKGNNYKVLQPNNPNAVNYVTQRVVDSMALVGKLNVGDKVWLYGTDLSAGIVDVNDKLWYEDDYVSNAYIKTGEPEEGKEAYDPNNAKPIGIDVIPTGIDNLVYDQKQSIIFTAKSGESAPHSVGKYEWWRAVVCEWDAEAGNYRIISLDRNVSATAVKQPLIPENGFVLMDCGANDAAIANLAVGMPVWLYDIDLAAGTRGEKARIRANAPDEEATAYDPAFTGSQLVAPAFTDAVGGILNAPAEGTTVNWSAVAGADEYVFALSESAINDDGAVLITRKTVTGTAYTIPADMLSVGGTYTITLYARGEGSIPGVIARAALKCVNTSALDSVLRDKKIIAFGDSLTARTGYVKMLYGYLGTEVINAGIGGNTTVHAKARFKADVLDQNPDIVLICFGMNDQAKQLSGGNPLTALADYRENLAYFARELKAAGADVVFVTPNPVCTEKGWYSAGAYGLDYGNPDNMNAFCNAMRSVAMEYGCTLVDINAECRKEDLKEFCGAGDGIHQSAYGHSRFAELIANHLIAVYDRTDKAEITVKCVDADGADMGVQKVYGHTGASIDIAAPAKSGYTPDKATVSAAFGTDTEVTFTYSVSDLVLRDGVNYVVEDGLVAAVPAGTKVSDFRAAFENTGLDIRDKIGGEFEDGALITTDSVIRVGDREYRVSVKGDADGNGRIDAVDYLYAKRAYLGTYSLTAAGKRAAAMADGNKIGLTDLIRLKRHSIGTEYIK